MTRARARLALPLALLLALASCAGPEKLSQQGEKELAQGNARKAYDKAKKALQKDPGNTHAAQLMTSAAKQLVEGRRKDILERASLSGTLPGGGAAVRERDRGRRALARRRGSHLQRAGTADHARGLPFHAAGGQEPRVLEGHRLAAGPDGSHRSAADREISQGNPHRVR